MLTKTKIVLFSFMLFVSFQLQAKSLQIMSYNVENLFDAKHDEGKNDWSFLPKDSPGKKEACSQENSKYRRLECFDADWTEEKVEIKLSQIVDVITKERTGLPDFLGLVEVENKAVLERLGKKLGFENLEITESPDKRGVDVALLYQTSAAIKKISRAEHIVPVDYPSRNILEVEFLIDGKYPLTLFVNHWPSLANPDSWRIKAAEVLANRVKEILKKSPQMNIIAMGDFNTIDENNPHPFKTVLHVDDLLVDVSKSFADDKSIDEAVKKKRPEGTYYYPPKKQWNMLDRFFYNQALKDSKDMEVNVSSFEIYLPQFALKEESTSSGTEDERDRKVFLTPKRFDTAALTKEKMGFSDHFAIVLKVDFPDTVNVDVKKASLKEKPKKKKK
jgi:endonuclease/exonuclease/phosphatase family metal-dependent hydrolase